MRAAVADKPIGSIGILSANVKLVAPDRGGSDTRRMEGQFLAQTRSADRIEECLSLEANRKTSARTEYFAF
jgi:hypothetical protein